MVIQLGASELERLSQDTRRQRHNILDVISQVEQALSFTEWRSSAAYDYQDLWRTDLPLLKQLVEDLDSWERYVMSQTSIAQQLNSPFGR